MSISIHRRSVPIGNIGANRSGSFGINLAEHITRNPDNVNDVKWRTESNINPDNTQYNQVFKSNDNGVDSDGVRNFSNTEKAYLAIDKVTRLRAEKYAGGITSKEETKLKRLRKEKKKHSMRLKRAKTKGNQKIIDRESKWLDDATDEIKRLSDKKKGGSLPDAQYRRWNANTGVGSFINVTPGHDTLYAQGWQFHQPTQQQLDDGNYQTFETLDGKTINYTRPFNVKEQTDYQLRHPNAVDSVSHINTLLYTTYQGINNHPERYGDVIVASAHFDETSPHLDLFTLNLGYDLNLKPRTQHVGLSDNGVDDVLNIRSRTYLNGNNQKGLNRQWSSKLQDRLVDDFSEAYHQRFPNRHTSLERMESVGVVRGKKKVASNKVANELKGNLRSKVKQVNSMVNSLASQSASLAESKARFEDSVKASMASFYKSSATSAMSSSADSLATDSASLSDASSAFSDAKTSAESSLSSASSSIASDASSVAKASAELSQAMMPLDDFLMAFGAHRQSGVKPARQINSIVSSLNTSLADVNTDELKRRERIFESNSDAFDFGSAIDSATPSESSKPSFANDINGGLDSMFWSDLNPSSSSNSGINVGDIDLTKGGGH